VILKVYVDFVSSRKTYTFITCPVTYKDINNCVSLYNTLSEQPRNISYNVIKEKPAFVFPGKIGDLSKHDCGRALFKSVGMFLSINRVYTDLLLRIAKEHKGGDAFIRDIMFDLLEKDDKLLEMVMKNLETQEDSSSQVENQSVPLPSS